MGQEGRSPVVLPHVQESVQFPGETMIFSVEGGNAAFGGKIRWMRGLHMV